MITLAPAFAQALPSLAGIPTEYNHEVHSELIYDLCSALVREGLGTPVTWKQCGENALHFAKHAIMSGIGAKRGDLLQRNVEYSLQISDASDRDRSDEALTEGQLVVTIDCGGLGYLEIGPAIDALECEAEGLGAAFYWALNSALYRVMRLYNHDDALMYEENLAEWAATETDEDNKAQYEFPEVEKSLPECIRKTLRRNYPEAQLMDRRLLRKYSRGRHRSWIERLRRIQQYSRLRVKQSPDYLEGSYYDGPPLPSLLVVFHKHDAITACFDEESQHMLESSSEPTMCAVFSPNRSEEAKRALRAVGRFVAINYELFQLVEEIHQEKDHASTGSDRGEPPLRAA